MSRSPERISSYRRHFEEGVSSSYQVRVSSPSPVRREGRAGSAARFPCGGGVVRRESGGRTMSGSRRSRVMGGGVGFGTLVCVGPTGQPPMDLDAAAAENEEFKTTRTSEKEEMIVLNDRLAVYIDKVRSLEQQNKLLEAEIEAYQNRFVKPSGLRQMYEEQLRELQKIADQMKFQRDIAFTGKDSTAAQLAAMKLKYEEAIELRKKAEAEIEAFRPDVDQATSSRIALEKRLEQLEVEIEFLKRVHQQEIEELMKQIYAAHVTAQSSFTLPDLAGALKQIQNQYDDIAAKNLQEMDSWYKNKFQDLTKKTSRHVDHVRSYREGIGSAKKDIQNKERELEALKTKNDALEAKIREMQEKYKEEIDKLQARIESLQMELKTTKEKIALHLREYQDLLNIKMSLEIEITTYRKLIEGEDLRLAGMMQTLSFAGRSMSAIGSGMSFGEGGVGGVGGTVGAGGGVVAGASGSSSSSGARVAGGGTVSGHRTDTAIAGKVGIKDTGTKLEGSAVGSRTSEVGRIDVGSSGRSGLVTGASETGHKAAKGDSSGDVKERAKGPRAGLEGSSVVSYPSVIGAGTDAKVGLEGESTKITEVGLSTSSGKAGKGVFGGGAAVEVGSTVREGSSLDVGTVVSGVSGPGAQMSSGDGKADSGGSAVAAIQGLGGGVACGDAGLTTGLAGPLGSAAAAAVAIKGSIGSGVGGNVEPFAEQAVEVTERRTVLIRTVKHANEVLEMDHQEQIYTIRGAAEESDNE